LRIAQREIQRGQHANRVLPILLERLADEKVLEEIHPRVAGIGTHIESGCRIQLRVVLADEPHSVGIAVSLGIRVRCCDRLVAVGIEALNESGSFLFEVRCGQVQAEVAALEATRHRQIELLLVQARLISPAAVVCCEGARAEVRVTAKLSH
jgi:hypothetical protein